MARRSTPAARWIHELEPISHPRWGWGFHTVRSGIGRENHRFPRVEGVDVVRYFLCGMGYYPPLSSSVAAELRRCPDVQLSQRAGSMSPEPISHQWMGVWFPHRAGRWGWGTHTVRSGIDRENHRFRPRVEGVEVLRYL